MDVYKLIVCLFICSVSTSAMSASQNNEIKSAFLPGAQVFKPQVEAGYYWLQVHATNLTPSIERYTRLFTNDLVVIHRGEGDINRVLVGPFKTFSAAIRAQQRAHEKEINDAFLRFSELPYEGINTNYWVQLYATTNPLNYLSLIQLRSLSQIKIISDANSHTRVLAGPFVSYQEAEAVRLKSSSRGMSGASVLTLSDQPL